MADDKNGGAATATPDNRTPLQKECDKQADQILTSIAEQLVAGVPTTLLLDVHVRGAFAEGVFAAIGLLQRGYSLTHVQDMLVSLYNNNRDRTTVHAVADDGAVRTVPSTDLGASAAGAGAVVSSLPTLGGVVGRGLNKSYGMGTREELIALARNIARDAHGDQRERSSGKPYVEHLARVAEYVREHASAVIAAAWLHDVLEDTPTSLDMLRAFGFPSTVLRAVEVLTRRSDQAVGGTDAHEESYADYIDRVVASGNHIAIVVKHADLVDHLQPGCPPELVARYRAAYKKIAPLATPLYALLRGGAPMPHPSFLDERESER